MAAAVTDGAYLKALAGPWILHLMYTHYFR